MQCLSIHQSASPPECFSIKVFLHQSLPTKAFSPRVLLHQSLSAMVSLRRVQAEQPAAPDLWGARAKDWVQPFVVGADCREISAVSHALARSLAHLQPSALMTSIIKRDRSPKSVCTAQCTPDSCHCSLKERLSSSNFYTDSKSLQS